MGRTAAGNDEKLIKTGLLLARAKGLDGFTVREVCAQSGVNLGMFHYYFTSKENFDHALLTALYQTMMKNLSVDVSPANAARENARNILNAVQRFARQNRRLLSSLAGDVFGGNAKILEFMGRNFTKHISMLFDQLERAKTEKTLKLPDITSAALVLVAPVVLPQLVAGLSERVAFKWNARVSKAAVRAAFSDEAAQQRVDILLDAVFGEEK